MRRLALLLLIFVTAAAQAAVRCAGTTQQRLTVKSGQAFALPVQPIAGVLDYDVTRATDWLLNETEIWDVRGQLVTNLTRPGSQPPAILERLYNTLPLGNQYVYYVVTATNAFDSTFHTCAQDFFVAVEPDPLLARDAARGVLPVVGSLFGANGSRYETRLTLVSPWDAGPPMTGRVVFHPTSRPATAGDPSLRYTLDSHEVQSWNDVIAAMGATGLGSIDIQPDRNEFGFYAVPDVRAEVVSIAANGGSFGTEIPLITADSAYSGAFWTLHQPGSITIDDRNGKKRLALGLRTLADAVDLTIALVAPDGTVRATVTRQLAGDYHEQKPLSDWFGALAQRFDRLLLSATRHTAAVPGGVIVYLSETDNVTNDVGLVLPQRPTLSLPEPVVQCSSPTGCNQMLH